ncbi:MAG: class I SAM-dependent methyltransferase [Gemmataceae bacterium]|nr:class I SAM-dependent methyltransferase [Gemmataceae bacterium]
MRLPSLGPAINCLSLPKTEFLSKEADCVDAKGLGKFFDSAWNAYRDLLVFDLMHHRDLFGILVGQVQRRFQHPVSFLDLACGDSDPARMVLGKVPVREYVGVDLAAGPLELARANLQPFGIPAEFFAQDFLEFLGETKREFDLILISYSIHHLGTFKKKEVFRLAKEKLSPQGIFVIIDGMRLAGQGRDAWLVQCFQYMEKRSEGKIPATFQVVKKHMGEADFPEEGVGYEAMGREAGFKESRLIHHDPASTFGVYLAGNGRDL